MELIEVDYPMIRASVVCPLCGGVKEPGLVCCWYCYHAKQLRLGNEQAEALFKQTETMLQQSGQATLLPSP